MKTLQINLRLLNYPVEAFSVDKDIIISDDIISIDSLSGEDKRVYEDFINLIGHNNVILTDITTDSEVICFNRIKLFDHDENYNILNLGSYLKSYNDYSKKDKDIIVAFLTLLDKY